VYSAGVETHGVNPRAIETMKEDGIDISGHASFCGVNCRDNTIRKPAINRMQKFFFFFRRHLNRLPEIRQIVVLNNAKSFT